MPEHTNPKRRPHPSKRQGLEPTDDTDAARAERQAGPVELWCRSNYSFLEGASHPDELVARAIELGYQAIAITDRCSLAGVVRAHVAARGQAIKLVVGAEIETEDAGPAVLLAPDRAAYARLSRLISLGRRRARKGEAHLGQYDLARGAEGLVALLPVAAEALDATAGQERLEAEAARLERWARLFGDRAFLAVTLHDGPDDEARLRRYEYLEERCALPLVAAGEVDAHIEERRPLRDALAAIRLGCRVDDLGRRLDARGCRPLRDLAGLARAHRRRPDLLERARALAATMHFSLDELRYEYPDDVRGRDLRALVEEESARRWPEGVPARVRELIEHELALISELAYEGYFLTVYDLVRFARSRAILCQGRGSAANSAVCYALGITAVDPDRFDLLFERFVSRDRNEPPDIDVDFEHERREEVIQYVYERYGRDHAALAATVITYRGRSAVRDLGKALGLALDQVERLARNLHYWDRAELSDDRLRELGLDPADPRLRLVMRLTAEIQGFPRHLSQHVGGMVITRGRLDELCPIENAAMDGRTVIQWDKDDLDALGILKVDCLALGMLTATRKCFQLIEELRGRRWELATIPAEVPAVYEMAGRADTIGVFQIESRAQMAMLPRFKPKRFYDLVIEVAIVRPGPIQGGMVHPYLRRRAGLEEVSYPSAALRDVLDKTLGVPIFQEQVMKLAVVAAGFSPGEADLLRRAMGAWRRPGLLHSFRDKLIDGMLERGYQLDFAEAVYRQIQGFGEYGFPESHAASFALLTYVSLWLKRFEPAAFTCALLNSLPMGFYGPAQLVADARRHGVPVRPVDVQRSVFDCRLETDGLPALRETAADPDLPPERYGEGGPALRLGFRQLKGLRRERMDRLVSAREEASFDSIEDCCRRVGLDRREAAILAEAGAFASFGDHRRGDWWRAGRRLDQAPLFPTEALVEERPRLEAPGLASIVHSDYRHAGLSLAAHPMELLRGEALRRGAIDSRAVAAARHKEPVTVIGISICRQRPATASGVMFVTLEDEFGQVNVILRVREQERFRVALLSGSLLLVKGQIERGDGDVVHLMAGFIANLSPLLRGLPTRSRDFH
ncbi:MAG: error-prone DNA polymerase [Planctomycetes bacterium]|nr:error-prone DNA polymerase [Planctomycetota bacterium]